MGRQTTLRTRVRFGETDAAGIVYYPTFFAWFDTGTHELLRESDAPGRDERGAPKYPFPIVECGATFIAPLRFDEEIDIVSTVASLSDSALRVEHEIRTLDGTAVARGYEQRVYVALRDGALRKAPIPADVRARLDGTPPKAKPAS